MSAEGRDFLRRQMSLGVSFRPRAVARAWARQIQHRGQPFVLLRKRAAGHGNSRRRLLGPWLGRLLLRCRLLRRRLLLGLRLLRLLSWRLRALLPWRGLL